jgi:hypothetical protein
MLLLLLSVSQGGLSLRPPLWHPSVELSPAEHTITKRIRHTKLCVFLWQHRHTLFADVFQQEGHPVQEEDLAHLWPSRFAHIHRYGKYVFDVKAARTRVGLRPLKRW